MSKSQIELESTECVVCHSGKAVPEARGKDYLHQTSEQEFLFCRCLDCGHLYLRPRPTIAEIGRIYPANYATFTNRFGRPGSLFAKVKDRILVGRFDVLSARLPSSMRLLDIGCGDGRFLLALRKRFPAAELTGLDWFFGAAIAKELANANIKTIAGTIETTPLPDEKFDVITMNQLIEHTWDARLVIDRCKRALTVGGLLAIETPNPDGWDRRLYKAGAWGGYYWPRHFNIFTRDHLTRIVTESGMEVVHTESLLSPPCWIYSCKFMAQRAGVGDWLNNFFSDTSLPLLTLFAVVDWIALLFGAETSNQKMVAKRVR